MKGKESQDVNNGQSEPNKAESSFTEFVDQATEGLETVAASKKEQRPIPLPGSNRRSALHDEQTDPLTTVRGTR